MSFSSLQPGDVAPLQGFFFFYIHVPQGGAPGWYVSAFQAGRHRHEDRHIITERNGRRADVRPGVPSGRVLLRRPYAGSLEFYDVGAGPQYIPPPLRGEEVVAGFRPTPSDHRQVALSLASGGSGYPRTVVCGPTDSRSPHRDRRRRRTFRGLRGSRRPSRRLR